MSEASAVPVTLAVGARTDTGRKRAGNEDSYLAVAPAFVVADGMGGHDAGDRASVAVVAAFRSKVPEGPRTSIDAVRTALALADTEVSRLAASTARGAGSTVAGVALIEHEGLPCWLVFNVGDSRVYRQLGTDLQQITVDHSLGQELVDGGSLRPDQLRDFAQRNVITRAIGAADSAADSWLLPVTTGERLLICSDGLTGEVSDEAIRATLTMTGRAESAADALVKRALDAGGRDNVTVVVIDVVAGGSPAVGEEPTGERLGAPSTESTIDATTLPVRVVR
ncbi:protein phosphatase 2C domain-containing protein [Agromyces sp. G08B096]|uniref:Protein phosphatase 2C domain-containing protein n=1 Tax=Agromyces sp. G08B096 TaxID=3156399 RepID=A0AAU7W641_9MICO